MTELYQFKDESISCCYCDGVLDHTHHLPLVCCECDKFFHVDCLSGDKPAVVLGDQLFTFFCSNCSPTGRDAWNRLYLNWVHVIHLALYNLMLTENGREGFFRWNTQICQFIDCHLMLTVTKSNWSCLIPMRQRTASWKCTVAGIMSVNCPSLFRSGTQLLGESGWWSLQERAPPILRDVLASQANDRTKKNIKTTMFTDSKEVFTDDFVKSDASLNFIESNEFFDYSFLKSAQENEQKVKKPKRLTQSQEKLAITHLSCYSEYYGINCNPRKARLYRKLKLREAKRKMGLKPFELEEYKKSSIDNIAHYTTSGSHDDPLPVMEQSFFDKDNQGDSSLYSASSQTDTLICDSKTVRKAQGILARLALPLMPVLLVKGVYNHESKPATTPIVKTFSSPYTSRLLKPVIFKSNEFSPVKVNLLTELVDRVMDSGNNDISAYMAHPISFCYFGEHHLLSVNAMVSYFFWPVNLKEYLQYPDFTVVVQYGKLVIGCGFMTPDVKVSEAYIPFLLVHPDFRGCGLAKIMLYHLIQSCQGKDVTLHVSVDNPAMLLYLQFGFKAEQFCINFYDKYYPPSCPLSKHAFLMRLRR